MKTYNWQVRLIVGVLVFAMLSSKIDRNVQAQTTIPPAQGCTVSGSIITCAFYVAANEDDAGVKPECNNYGIFWPEIYIGTCSSGASIVSGFRFQSVSLPPNQSILASYIEFTVDGPFGVSAVTANIYGQTSASPNSFTGTSTSDITNRPTVAPTATWNIASTNTGYNMGDPWVLGYTRRTPDITQVISAIMDIGWQNNNPMAFLFKNMTANPTSSRRVISKERSAFTTFQPARLVFRLGQVPRPSVSYYWQSVLNVNGTTIINPAILEIKAKTEAERNQTVLVILDFGSTDYSSVNIGTKLTSTNISVSTSAILNGAKTYIQKFIQYSQPASRLVLGVGTNNTGDMMCSTTTAGNHGQAWATMINDLQSWVNQQGYGGNVTVAGANDIESWAGQGLQCGTQLKDPSPPQNALAWAQAYSATTDVYLINYGAVDSVAIGLGNGAWGADTFWQLSWGIPEILPFPEIYSTTGGNATMWQQLARFSAICTGCIPEQFAYNPNWVKGRTMLFLGTLTNQGEQSKITPCSTNTNSPSQGWLHLYRLIVVDLSTDSIYWTFPQFSSDITFEDQDVGLPPSQTHETADTCAFP